MFTKRIVYACASFAICGLLAVVLLLGLSFSRARAESGAGTGAVTRYVSPAGHDAGNDCASAAMPCHTVQHAVEAAQPGDEIRVAAGTYMGTMAAPASTGFYSATVVITKELSALLGGYSPDFTTRQPEINETILSAAGALRQFVVFLSEVNTVVDGFTMTGATGACPTDCAELQYGGGAVWVRGGAPTLSHNRIEGNRAYYYGGGIYVSRGASPIITANVIMSNTALYHVNGGGLGGGIAVRSASAAINGNQILANTADVEGGGIFVGWDATVTVASNTIAHNRVISPTVGRGAGIRAIGDRTLVSILYNEVYSNTIPAFGGAGLDVGSSATVEGNHLHHNQGDAVLVADSTQSVTLTNNVIAHNSGAGLWMTNFSHVSIVNNTIVQNSRSGIDTYVAETTPISPSVVTIVNNIVVGNNWCGVYLTNKRGGLTVMADYNDVVGNNGTFCNLLPSSIGTHNIAADPRFVDAPHGNLRLASGSPAIDAGTAEQAPARDKDGVARPQGRGFDMGAYEAAAPRHTYLPLIMVRSNTLPPAEDMISIPAGTFRMGCDGAHPGGDGFCRGNFLPLHTVYLDAFRISRTEVTNARYALCVAAGICTPPSSNSSATRPDYYGNPVYDNYPVINVTWHQAAAYCAWIGGRLPSEAEWEKAARGASDTRAYPWGDAAPDCTLANVYRSGSGNCVGDTSAAGSYPAGASPFGALDMAGNVREWVNDWYSDSYYSVSPGSNPPGPETRTYKGTRGNGWYDGVPMVFFRNYGTPTYPSQITGFRCAAAPIQ